MDKDERGSFVGRGSVADASTAMKPEATKATRWHDIRGYYFGRTWALNEPIEAIRPLAKIVAIFDIVISPLMTPEFATSVDKGPPSSSSSIRSKGVNFPIDGSMFGGLPDMRYAVSAEMLIKPF